MTEIIVSISLYLIAAILVGFTFGWFIAKAMLKEKYDEQLEILTTLQDSNDVEKIQEELKVCRDSNRELIASKNAMYLQYEEKNAAFEKKSLSVDTFNRGVERRDDTLEKLTEKYAELEEKYLGLKHQHEKEIDAFLEERVDITQKYRDLLAEVEKGRGSLETLSDEKSSSWFGKVFKEK
jgi:predicted nuclease with TOPRIM domain